MKILIKLLLKIKKKNVNKKNVKRSDYEDNDEKDFKTQKMKYH